MASDSFKSVSSDVVPLAAGTSAPHLMPRQQVVSALKVRVDHGLSEREVLRRRAQWGENEIPRQRARAPIAIFLDRFKDPLVLFLLAAGGLSLWLREIGDALIIAVAISLDALLSYIQVWRTERTLERLRQHVQQRAHVLRGGELVDVEARELVPGDIIEFRAGQKLPADARILQARGLQVHESALTGESLDVSKTSAVMKGRTPLGNRRNMVYLGTVAMAGSGRAVVTATGARSEFGKIAQVLKGEKEPVTPLRRKLARTGMVISVGIVVLVSGMMAVSIWSGASFADSGHTAVTLIVSAIPEDLTVILTIALTVGVVRILKQRGVVRELSSGETLGSATVICTDKTGTLTRGEMTGEYFDFLQGTTVRPPQPLEEPLQELALIALALGSDARAVGTGTGAGRHFGSATGRAMLAFAETYGFEQTALTSAWRERDALAFDGTWKYRASLHDHPTQSTQTLFVVGAPEVLLQASAEVVDEQFAAQPLTSQRRVAWQKKITARAGEGHRMVGVAVRRHMSQDHLTRRDVHDLLFVGVLGITDPVRVEVVPAIAQTQSAGVAVKLVTGDYEATARSVARAVGLTVPEGAVLTGERMAELSDADLAETVDHTVIFARVNPLDKRRIVRALQQNGHVVAMTGDGVNDAVALKVADIGVAMGSGKDVAKDAADLVLLDDSFATIVAAIREGRVVRDNVRKVISFLLSTNAAEIAIFLCSLALGLPLPLLPAQILWINLVTDGTSDIALSLEPEEDNVMRRRPEDPFGALITGWLTSHIVWAGVVLTAATMGLYLYLYNYLLLDLSYVRTITFSFLAVASLLSTWSYRSLWQTVLQRGIWQNLWLFGSAGFSLALQLLAVYHPVLQAFFGTVALHAHDWLLILVVALIAVVLIDVRKVVLPHRPTALRPDRGVRHDRLRVVRALTAE